MLHVLKRSNTYAKLVQVDGIEPTNPAWKAGVLPLNYTCKTDNSYGLLFRLGQVNFYKKIEIRTFGVLKNLARKSL